MLYVANTMLETVKKNKKMIRSKSLGFATQPFESSRSSPFYNYDHGRVDVPSRRATKHRQALPVRSVVIPHDAVPTNSLGIDVVIPCATTQQSPGDYPSKEAKSPTSTQAV